MAVGQHDSNFGTDITRHPTRMLTAYRFSCFEGLSCRQLRHLALGRAPLRAGSVSGCSRVRPASGFATGRCLNMTSLTESVGRENIPEPAAKLQKLSPPPEPPLLVKKLSEHATIPKRGSAKAAGYDLSR